MWNRLSGKSYSTGNDAPSPNKAPWSKDEDQYSRTTRKTLSRDDDRDRGFNPTPSSYSSMTHGDCPGSVAASGSHVDNSHKPADSIRNSSLAEQMPKSKSSREGDRERDSRSGRTKDVISDDKERDRGVQRREKNKKRSKEEYDDKRSSRTYRYIDGRRGDEEVESSRAPADFPDQVGAPGFSQFPGQSAGASLYSNGDSTAHAMSSHVQDQFPGQFPVQSTTPYRPPIALSEGGPGLAAEYYADAGESVAEQPGVRTNTPSLIIGAEPHLLPASAVEAPPPEPSASGGVGAAASFYSGEFDDDIGSLVSHGPQSSSTYTTAQNRPSGSSHSASAPVIPTLGGAVSGSAAGHQIGEHNSLHTQRPHQASSSVAAHIDHMSSHQQRPPSPIVTSSHSNTSRPSKPNKHSTHTSNLPLYGAGVAGTAAAFYNQNYPLSSQQSSIGPQYSTTPMARRHRIHGPFGALIDFFKDPDGVAKYEEYSEFVGVCRTCFAPGSSPRDAPRKHHYRKRRSNEALGRVDKDSRYYSSEKESRRIKEQSWLANGLAGYGLAKIGESLFKQRNDFDDDYSVKTGRHSPERGSHKSQRRSRSRDRIETGTTSNDHIYKTDSRRDSLAGSRKNAPEIRRPSGSRSRSRSRPQSLDRKSSTVDTRMRIGINSSPNSGPNFRRRESASPKGTSIKTKHKKEAPLPERRPKVHKKRKARGFFSLSSASSSSSSMDLREDLHRHRNTKRTTNKSRDDRKAEAAILGLGAAAAAFAMKGDGAAYKKKGVKKLVVAKEPRNEDGRAFRDEHRSDEEVWESAPELEHDSADSGLAYGGLRRRGSRDSISSQSSGTDKWGWRWGSKKRRDSSSRRHAFDDGNMSSEFGAASVRPAGLPIYPPNQYQGASLDSASSLPLQQVFPVPTSDPTRFDVGQDGPIATTTLGHTTVVPIQHPQPITPVATALYSSRPPYEHSYSAPMIPPVLPHRDHVSQSAGMDARSVRPDTDFPNRFNIPQVAIVSTRPKDKRRDSSPARVGVDTATSPMAPSRRSSAKDDTPIVRFDRTEEQEEDDRRERRRKRKEDKERREAEEQDQIEKERRSNPKRDRMSESDTKKATSPDRSSPSSWAEPGNVAVGAMIGVATASVKSRPEETREERRERRIREREREEQEDEDATRKRERHRKKRDIEQERDAKGGTVIEASKVTGDTVVIQGDTDSQARPAHRNERSVWQEAASPKRTVNHENYGDFFKPLDLSDDQVKITSAKTNSDVDFDRTPAIVTVEPKGSASLDDQPVFSLADTDEKIDTSSLSFAVPKLRLVEPTPPSSRGSTPTIQPCDVVDAALEERTKDSPPSEAAGDKGQMHDYTVVSPPEERQEVADPTIGRPSDLETVDTTEHLEQRSLLNDKKQDLEQQVHTDPSVDVSSYGDDLEFAATLAASAEDAGFDPAIVIDDPNYRRRESPTGSADRSMPGGFDDGNDLPSLSKIERKKRDRAARNRDTMDASKDGDDEAVVKDIIKQAENPESQIAKSTIDGLDDEWKGSKKTKSKKSKKGRKGSGMRDELLEASEPSTSDPKTESREANGSVTENAPSVETTAPKSDDVEVSKKLRKNSKRNSDKFADTMSNMSSSSTVSGSNEPVPKTNVKPKNSIWDRVLNRSAVKVTHENGTRDTRDEEEAEVQTDTPVKSMENGIASEEARPSRDDVDGTQLAIRSNATSSALGEQDYKKGAVQDSGRITQDLPAKDRESSCKELSGNDKELEQPDVQQSESFLDMSPEPPPPPDSSAIMDKSPNTSEASKLPGSLRSLQDDHNEPSREKRPHQLPGDRKEGSSEVHTPDPLSTPTAVPFDFRFSGPRPSIRLARSMSQTRLPTHSSPSHAPRPRPRPRSTEFSSSKEFRPLMLVERHKSHQASAPEETYPSLPSSHTTSRSSSVHDPVEGEGGDYEMMETSHEHLEAEHVLASHVDHSVLRSDLLDSQQATPTASSFQHSISENGPSSTHDGRSSSPNPLDRDTAVTSPSEDAASDTRELEQIRDSTSINLPQEEQDHARQGLDEMDENLGTYQISEDDLPEKRLDNSGDSASFGRHIPLQGLLIQRASDDTTQKAIVNPTEGSDSRSQREEGGFDSRNPQPRIDEQALTVIEAKQGNAVITNEDSRLDEGQDHMEDYFPQGSRDGRSNEGRAGKSENLQDCATLPALEAPVRLEDTPTGYVDPEQARQLQEQDAQDAVDSWFLSATPKSKDKKRGIKGVFEQSPKIVAPSEHSEDTLKDNVEANDPVTEQHDRDTWSTQGSETISALPSSIETEKDIPQPTSLPDQGFIPSQLERKQSKSKGRKAQKSRKSLSQGDDFRSASQAAKVLSSTNRDLKRSPENGALPSEPNPATLDKEAVDAGNPANTKTESPFGPRITPDPRPLPKDNHNYLLDETQKNVSVDSEAESLGSQASLFSKEASHQNQAQEQSESLAQHSIYSSEMDVGQQVLHEVDAQPLTGEAVGSEEPQQSPRGRNFEAGSEQGQPLVPTMSDENLCEQAAVLPAQSAEECQPGVKIADAEWVVPGSDKKGKRSKKAKPGPVDVAESKIDDRMESLVPAAVPKGFAGETPTEPEPILDEGVNSLDTKTIASISQNEPETISDETADVYSKKTSKKGKKAKRSSGLETSAPVDIEQVVPVAPSKWVETRQVDEPTSYLDFSASHVESENPQDDWTGFSSKKQAKKARKRKTDSSGASMNEDFGTKAGPLTPLEEAREGPQPEDSTQMPSASPVQEVPEGTEDQLAGFSTKKRAKKGKHTKSKLPEADKRTASLETLPLKVTKPQDLQPKLEESNAKDLPSINSDSIKPDVVEPDLARVVAFDGDTLTPAIGEPQRIEPGSRDLELLTFEPPQPEAIELEREGRETNESPVAEPREFDLEKLELEKPQQDLIKLKMEESEELEAETVKPGKIIPERTDLEIEQSEGVSLGTQQTEEIAPAMIEPERFAHEVDKPEVDEREIVVRETKEKLELIKPSVEPIRSAQDVDIPNQRIGLHAATATSQEVTAMVEAGETQRPSENPTAEKVSSNTATNEQYAQQLTTDQSTYESDQLLSEMETLDQSTNCFLSQNTKLIGQYVSTDDQEHQDFLHNKNATAPVKEVETQELQLPDQYGKDDEIPSSLVSHMDTHSAAYDVEEKPVGQQITTKPDRGAHALANYAVMDETFHNRPPEDAESTIRKPMADSDQKREKSIDLPVDQSSVADQSPLHNPSIDGPENGKGLSDRQLDERSGKAKEPLLDEAKICEPAQDFATPELETAMSQIPEIGVTESSIEEVSPTDAENGLGLQDLDISRGESIRAEGLGAHEESLSTEKHDESRFGELQGLNAVTSLKTSETASSSEQAYEDRPGVLHHSQPMNSDKDNKRAKKAKSTARDARSQSILQSRDHPVREIRSLEDANRDPSIPSDDNEGDSHVDAMVVRTASKEERKKPKYAQSLSRENLSLPESDIAPQTDQGSEGRREAEPKDTGRGSFVGSAITDHNSEPPFSMVFGQSPNDPPSDQEPNTSAPLPAEETSEAPEESQDQAKLQLATVRKDPEPGQYPTPSSKRGKKDKKKGKKSRNTISANTEDEGKPQGIDDSKSIELQDEPRTVPIVAESLDQSGQALSNEELEPTEAVKSDANSVVRQQHDEGLDKNTLSGAGDDTAQPMETGEDGFAIQKKGKKSKRFRKDKGHSPEASANLPLAEPFSTPECAVTSTSNCGKESGDPSQNAEETLSKPESSNFPISEVEPTDPIQAFEVEAVNAENPAVELWDVPAKKNKKSREQRGRIPLLHTDSRTLESTSSKPPEVISDNTEIPLTLAPTAGTEATDPHTACSQPQTPRAELLDPLEQHQYDLDYVQELGRQGVASPRSSRVELPALVGDAEATVSQEQSTQERERGDYVKQDQDEAIPTSVLDEPAPSQNSLAGQPRERGKDEAEYPSDLGKHTEVLRSPTTTSSSQGASYESLENKGALGNNQSVATNFGQEELNTSQTSTEELPTPAAEIEMLDAQEQEAYDKEYARELERQLSPPREERSDSRINLAHANSTSLPTLDSSIGMPVEQRAPLARPPPLEDIIEEPRSRASSAQETSEREEGSSPFSPPKKSRKGKKGKKQQQPIIWEDDTATPPVATEVDLVGDLPASSHVASPSPETEDRTMPVDLEEPIESQHIDQISKAPIADIEETSDQEKADDYFTIRPSRIAEEDVGRDLDNDEFRRSLSTEPTYSYQERSPRRETEPSMETTAYLETPATQDEKTGAESVNYSRQPESAPNPSEGEVEEDSNYVTTRKGKKRKKLKKIQADQTSSASIEESTQPAGQSAAEFTARDGSALENPPERDLLPETRTIIPEEDARLEKSNSESNKGLPAAVGMGAAVLTTEGISRLDSKKGGKKEKKGKKSKWARLDEDRGSGSPPFKDEAIAGNVASMPAPEPEHEAKDLHSVIPSVNQWHTSSELEITHPSQPEASTYRDSAINVSESPLTSEETPLHRPIRDSGYPETESSPIIGVRQGFENTHVETTSSDSRPGRSNEYLKDYNHGYRTPERGRLSNEDQPDLSTQFDPSYESPISKSEQRHRRSKSYDSDDSADSGFDIQRRRRRQAISREAREPSPVSSTTKDRSSALVDSSPPTRQDAVEFSHVQKTSTRDDSIRQEPKWSFSRGDLPSPTSLHELTASHPIAEPETYTKMTGHQGEQPGSLFGGPVHLDEDTVSKSISPPISETRDIVPRLKTISEDSQERPFLHGKGKHSISDLGSPEASVKEPLVQPPSATARSENDVPNEHPCVHDLGPPNNSEPRSIGSERSRSPKSASHHSDISRALNMAPKQRDGEQRAASATSMRSDNSIHAIIKTPDQVRSASGQSYRSSGTPPLRRVDRSVSGDLRAASKLKEAKTHARSAEAELSSDIQLPSSSTYDPVTDKGKSRADMADVYEGWGDVRGQSPMSPTRPPSMRKRQSMQILDLETRLDQLVSENRLLLNQKATAERTLQDQASDHDQQRHAYEEGLQQHKMYLSQKDSELNEMRAVVEEWQNRVDQLREVNEELTSSRALNEEHEQRYRDLEDEHAHLKERHTDLTTGMEALVQREVATHLEAKNSELQQLRVELESAKQQVRSLQQQLLTSREGEDFIERDEDYFEGQCQSLCQHVQQWVLRFSKFSDMKACYRASEIRDETKLDRMENAILDGTDVDTYLQDRVKRRDVFMAVVMTMVFDYIFTRYLFGMDREQRQKLKNLEKTLQDIGPMSAVCKWRATTLTLLMRRQDFARQRATDTEAIVHEIFDTLSTFLPPPSHLVAQIQDSLRKVINAAADLSIEMRTQRADYQMLPPLQPDYDTNGDLAQKVYFNALTMNERSGATTSNQVLQEQGAVVRMVLFPLVVKNEEDDEQIIVCPAQVLTANSKGKKTVRVMSVQGSTQGGRSEASFGDVGMEGGMI